MKESVAKAFSDFEDYCEPSAGGSYEYEERKRALKTAIASAIKEAGKRNIMSSDPKEYVWMKKGVRADYHSTIGGPITRSLLPIDGDPFLTSGGQWVIFVKGISGYVSCDALTISPVQEQTNPEVIGVLDALDRHIKQRLSAFEVPLARVEQLVHVLEHIFITEGTIIKKDKKPEKKGKKS